MAERRSPKPYNVQADIRILCTREIDAASRELCARHNILIDELSFIQTLPVETVEMQQEIEQALTLPATVVFTSMNAVEAVAGLVWEEPSWKIYCIGNTTRRLVIKYFGEDVIAGFAQDAAALATLIIEENKTSEVIFFCGNRRREELPTMLKDKAIAVEEVVVYETIDVPHIVSVNYMGILFFSPSAVQSFFIKNKAAEGCVFFAIGRATADTIKRYTRNRIIVAGEPGKENLVETMVSYFT